MRGKRLKTLLLTGVVLLTAAGFMACGGKTEETPNTKVEDKKVEEDKESSKENKKEEVNKEDSNIYKVGEEGVSGNWNIKVLEAKEETTIQAGNSSDDKTTKEKFIVIKLQMKNTSKQPSQYSPKEFRLGNMNDESQYDVAFEAMQAANNKEIIYNKNDEFFNFYDNTNPNMSKQTYVIFEVPKDTKIEDYVLINGNNGAEATGFFIK